MFVTILALAANGLEYDVEPGEPGRKHAWVRMTGTVNVVNPVRRAVANRRAGSVLLQRGL